MLYCVAGSIYIYCVQDEISEVHSFEQRRKALQLHFLINTKPKQLLLLHVQKLLLSVAVPHLPVLEIWNSLNPLGEILFLVFLQYICWCDLDWAEVQVRKCLCGLRLQKKEVTFDLKKKKTVGIYSPPNGYEWFHPEGWVSFSWVKNRAFSLSVTSGEQRPNG